MPHIRNLRASHMENIGRRTSRVENRSPLRNGAISEGELVIRGTGRIVFEGDDNLPSIPVATSSRSGLMPAADKAKLDAATPNSTANTLVQRNSSGRFNVPQPTGDSNPVRLADLNAVNAYTSTDLTQAFADAGATVSSDSAAGVVIEKTGLVVVFSINIVDFGESTFTIPAVIPAAYRPRRLVYEAMSLGHGTGINQVDAGPNGQVRVRGTAGLIRGSMTWITN